MIRNSKTTEKRLGRLEQLRGVEPTLVKVFYVDLTGERELFFQYEVAPGRDAEPAVEQLE